MFEGALQLVRAGVGSAYPGAAVAIGIGHKVLARQFFGLRQENPIPLALTEDTRFDLASLSKLTTTMVALKFLENGVISCSDRIDTFFADAGNYGDCELRHLLTHTTGMPPGIPLYAPAYRNSDPVHCILHADRVCNTGAEVHYSCMGYIVLQRILEQVGGEPLDRLASKYVFAPLGMHSILYNPGASVPVAATEYCTSTGQWATGHVHDENAYFLGGVSGNAGVFATLDDMIAFAGMCSARGIARSGDAYLPAETFDLAVRNHTPGKAETRGLGFLLKGDQPFPMGQRLPRGSYGHTGFTGTSLCVDCETGLWGILLTNAVHYGRENRAPYFSLRSRFYDEIVTEFRSVQNKA